MVADVLTLLAEPLQYPFMVRGMAAAVMVGLVCAVVGTYVILRGMAFLGDALAHAILPGVAVGYIVGGGSRVALFWWALGTAIASSLGIGAIHRRTRFREDTAIGILFAGMFALGIAIISSARSYTADLAHFLFGNVLAVSPADLMLMAVFGVLTLGLVALFYKELLVLTFDETFASTLRLPAGFLYYLLLVLVAVTTVVSLQTVGIALVLAMLVTPPATAMLVTRRLPAMMAVAAAIGAVSGVSGLYISYYAGVASGAAIVLVSMAFFGIGLLVSPRRNRFWRRDRQPAAPGAPGAGGVRG